MSGQAGHPPAAMSEGIKLWRGSHKRDGQLAAEPSSVETA